MSEHEGPKTFGDVAEAASAIVGLAPYFGPLARALGPFGLEPRLRELVALAVARADGSTHCEAVHRTVGRLAGLTEAERRGVTDFLTEAERSALAVGLRTVSRLAPAPEAGPADEHFTSEQLEQLRAVALAADTASRLSNSLLAGLRRAVGRAPAAGPAREAPEGDQTEKQEPPGSLDG